jgi:transglutaminase-like putative cysteine protease
MSYRLTITAAVAVILASFSLLTVITGLSWVSAGIGAVVVVAAAGLATRLAPVPAAVTATAAVLIAVVPLLTGHSWPVRILGLALVAVAAASFVSRVVFPPLADVGTYLAALLIYLNLVFAGAQSPLRVIPTVRSMRHLGHLASLGYSEHNYAPPVPTSRGLDLIAAAGIGAVAILVDLFAVRMRSPAVAGLPLLVLFSVPVATNVKHVGAGLTLAFCLGITGYLALLAADGRDRLRLWGRLVTVWQEDPDDDTARGPDTRALAASGRRIGLAAVAIAVILPLTLPGLKEHGLLGHSPGTGNGGHAVPAPSPLVQMRAQLFARSNQTFLTYRTTATDVPEQYLQIYVLNLNSAGSKWVLADRTPSATIGSAPLRAVPGLAPTTAYDQSRTTITIGKAGGYTGQMSYLPVPYAPAGITIPGKGWQETGSTLMVYGYRSDANLKYTVTSRTATPTPGQLSVNAKLPVSVQPYLQYTGPDKAKLLKIARQITRGDSSHFSQAETLESYFRQTGGFSYNLTRNPPSSVLQFLTRDKYGFCQQFAFSMAVLARLLGIPSRVAVGYTAGTFIGHRTWKVTSGDAHAWPELYFPGAGWLRFEPTPGGAGGQGTAIQPVYTAPTTPTGSATNPTLGGTTAPVTSPSSGASTGPLSVKKPLVPTGGEGQGGSTRKSAGFPIGLLIAAIVVLLLVTPALTRVVIRRRRWLTASGDLGRAHAAWRELTSDLVDYGLGGAPSETPRTLARRVSTAGELDGAGREAVERIAAAQERAQYARTPASSTTLRADGHTVRRAMARAARPGERWRARLLPASVLGPVRSGLRQSLDVFGWLDAGSLRLRRSAGHAWRVRRAH